MLPEEYYYLPFDEATIYLKGSEASILDSNLCLYDGYLDYLWVLSMERILYPLVLVYGEGSVQGASLLCSMVPCSLGSI